MINRAMQFAEKAHEGQTRSFQGIPYVWHPHSVSKLVETYSNAEYDTMVLRAAAMLHDVVEDCDVSFEEIKDKFGRKVSRLVRELTSNESEVEKVGKTNYLKTEMVEMSNQALFIKLCDRLDNVSDLRMVHNNFREKYIDETLEILSFLRENRELTSLHREICSDIDDQIERVS